MADNRKKDPRKTPQDKHKFSAFTAADDIEYRQHQIQAARKGKKHLSKREWYNKKHGKKD